MNPWRRILERFADVILGISETVADAATPPRPGETSRSKARRLRRARKANRERRRRERKRERQSPAENALEDARQFIAREREALVASPEPEQDLARLRQPRARRFPPGEGPGRRWDRIRGGGTIRLDDERHRYATDDEALAAYYDLEDAGVASDWMVVAEDREAILMPFVLFVNPS